jgi:RNA-directed DNA polymerase
MTKMERTKSQAISKRMVWDAYKLVKANKGASGVDGIGWDEFDSNLSKNLYKLWNRMASGSYFPKGVKEVLIDKGGGKTRSLGIPTITDRIAQKVVSEYLEPRLEEIFHDSSYGYRPGRSQHQALARTRENCFKYGWVIDLDIKGFFDNLNHDSLLKLVNHHAPEKWVVMYITRWLKAEVFRNNGQIELNELGTPQGGVISPLLANLFLHYAFDRWMFKHFPNIKFERYADDIIVHCSDEEQAKTILIQIRTRLEECKLSLNLEKSKIVYCRDGRKRRSAQGFSDRFTFLGFEFKSRRCVRASGKAFTGFTPAISPKSVKRIKKIIRQLAIHRWTPMSIEEIAVFLNPRIRGWLNYYGKFRRGELNILFRFLNYRIQKWILNKYKITSLKKGVIKYRQFISCDQNLFVHWKAGFVLAYD